MYGGATPSLAVLLNCGDRDVLRLLCPSRMNTALISRSSQRALGLILAGLSFLAFVIYQGLVWYPEFELHYVPSETITLSMTEQGRTQPPDATFEELHTHRFLPRNWESDQQLIATGDKLLKGRAELPGYPEIDIHHPFEPADLDRGSELWQLQFAAMVVPEVLLDSYRITGREEFFEAARDDILAWAKFEKGAWLDRGFLWNDHAVAARVRMLADFWGLYRHRSDYRSDVAAEIWAFAARNAALLAKPELYTFATNHGVMQNLALWQSCLTFPFLPRTKEYTQIAFLRLNEELGFYVSPEGPVLEHSAGYHEFGLFLFGMALRYATLLNLDISSELREKYENAERFYSLIRRPDGSLPPFGDTGIDERQSALLLARPDEKGRTGPLTLETDLGSPEAIGIYPASGYAVIWDGLREQSSARNVSQTVLVYSDFPGHGHKHADEPSVLLWANGWNWWTSSGYWPYDDINRSHAECWEGSNAPHLSGEKCDTSRNAKLLSYLQTDRLFAAEIERNGPGGLIVRRLMVHVQPSVWIVADQITGVPQGNVQTIWTTAPEISLKPGSSPGAFDLSARGTQSELHAYFLGPQAMTVQTFRGSHHPFAGWVTQHGEPRPADAVLTEQPSDGAWAITIWVLDDSLPKQTTDKLTSQVHWNNAQSWKVLVPLTKGGQLITRDGKGISLSLVPGPQSSPRTPITTSLNDASANLSERAVLDNNYRVAAARYPRVRDLFSYRLRASSAAIVIFLLQELVVALYRRVSGKHLTAFRILTLLGWVGLSLFAVLFYLRAS